MIEFYDDVPFEMVVLPLETPTEPGVPRRRIVTQPAPGVPLTRSIPLPLKFQPSGWTRFEALIAGMVDRVWVADRLLRASGIVFRSSEVSNDLADRIINGEHVPVFAFMYGPELSPPDPDGVSRLADWRLLDVTATPEGVPSWPQCQMWAVNPGHVA